MPAFKKACPRCACEIHVRKSKCPCGYSFSVKPKLILKPQNAMKSLDSRKKTMVMCQARKRDLESVEQSQKRKLADSECHAHKKPMRPLRYPRVVSKLMLNVMPVKEPVKYLKNLCVAEGLHLWCFHYFCNNYN